MAAKGAFAQPARASSDLNRLQSSSRILIKGAVVISMDRDVGDFANADILIEGGKIREVRPGIAADPESTVVLDGRDRIVIPGFVDTHHHYGVQDRWPSILKTSAACSARTSPPGISY